MTPARRYKISIFLPETYRTYIERTYPAESIRASFSLFLTRPPMPPIHGGVQNFTRGNIQKIVKIFEPCKTDPFYGSMVAYFERRLNENTKQVPIDSRTVFEVSQARSAQFNVAFTPREFDLLQAIVTKHSAKGISPALRREIEEDALRHGFRLHTTALRTPTTEF